MRLATFNLLHGRSLSDGVVDNLRLHEAVKLLDADVLGLQEVDRHQQRSHLTDLTAEVADAMGAVDFRFVSAISGTPGEVWRPATDTDAEGSAAYGIGLVSRLPVTAWHVLRLPAAPVRSPIMIPGTRKVIWLQDEPRVAIAAEVETEHGPLTVATTHLSFVPVWNGVQLRKVTSWLEGLPGPRVLLGDLNMPGPFPRVLSGWRSLASAKTYPSTEPKIQLDHVLGHGSLPSVIAVETPVLPLSDHRALAVVLAPAARD